MARISFSVDGIKVRIARKSIEAGDKLGQRH